MLQTSNLTVRFGGHVAVNAVSCGFAPGTLTAIVGPNGAGKTTYFNLISGQIKASAGTVTLDGRDLTNLSAPLRTRAGLGRAFQLTNLFPQLSVRENVRMAVQARAGAGMDTLMDLPVRHPDEFTAKDAEGKTFVGGVINPLAGPAEIRPFAQSLPFGAICLGADLPDALGDVA